jgi:hypothetical protein
MDFKVVMYDRVPDHSVRERLRESLQDSRGNSLSVFSGAGDLFVNWWWLSNFLFGGFQSDKMKLIDQPIALSREAGGIYDQILTELKQWQNDEIETSQTKVKSDPSELIFTPSAEVNNKTERLGIRVIKASFFLDLLLLPEDRLPTKKLMALLEAGITLDSRSLGRMHHLFLTAAPGKVEYKNLSGEAPVQFDDSLTKWIENSSGDLHRDLIHVSNEREALLRMMRNTFASHKAVAADIEENIGEHLRRLGFTEFSTPPRSFEDLLNMLNGQAQ